MQTSVVTKRWFDALRFRQTAQFKCGPIQLGTVLPQNIAGIKSILLTGTQHQGEQKQRTHHGFKCFFRNS